MYCIVTLQATGSFIQKKNEVGSVSVWPAAEPTVHITRSIDYTTCKGLMGGEHFACSGAPNFVVECQVIEVGGGHRGLGQS
jgi:hypothetical protein